MRGAIRTDHNLVKLLPAWNRRGRVNWVVLFEKVITVRAEVEIGKGSRERVMLEKNIFMFSSSIFSITSILVK